MKLADFLFFVSFLVLTLLLWLGVNVVVFIFLVPLILLALKSSIKSLIIYGSVSIILSGLLWLYWIKLYDLKLLFVALLCWCVFFVVFLSGTRCLCRMPRSSVLIPPTIWFLLSVVFSFTKIGDSWTELAMFHSMSAPLIWLVGAKGITFLVVLVNSLFARLILCRTKECVVSLVCLLIVFGSCFLFSSNEPANGSPVKIAGLQGNFDQSWEWRCANADGEILDTYIGMTKESSEDEPDIIIWPEYAVPADVLEDEGLRGRIELLASETDAWLIVGSLKWLDGFLDWKRKRNDVALIVSPETGVTDTYASVKPLPYDKAVAPGERLHLLGVAGRRAGVLLCYEETLSWPARKLSKQGAEFLVSLANNSRFLESRGVQLTSLQTRLRAAENGKYLVRVTNTGITQIISPRGKVVSRLDPFEKASLIVDIQSNGHITPYSRFDDILVFLMIFLLYCLRSATPLLRR